MNCIMSGIYFSLHLMKELRMSALVNFFNCSSKSRKACLDVVINRTVFLPRLYCLERKVKAFDFDYSRNWK